MTAHSMPRSTAYAVLAALAAVVVLVSTAIFVGVGGRSGGVEATPGRTHGTAAPASSGRWLGTWSAAPAAAEPDTEHGFPGMSIRNVVHVSVGGTSTRVQLSNLYGRRPLTISHSTVALAAAPSDPAAAAGTMRRLTFGQRQAVTIPVGRTVTSDPVRMTVPAASDLLVTTYTPEASGPVTYHPHARQTSYLADGERTEDTVGLAFRHQTPYWRYLTAVDVWSGKADGAVVVFGDSITDGITSTAGANRRWTDVLAERLRVEPGAPRYSVLNEGISGNKLLSDGSGNNRPPDNPRASARFERDVLDRTGAKAVVIQLGVNDVLHGGPDPSAERIVSELGHLVARAHGRGLRVVGATLMPFQGHRGFSARLETVRQTVNQQIRDGQVFDAVVDFDQALRDPTQPARLLPHYDSGDHLHPSDAGYRTMAEALRVGQLRGTVAAAL